MARTLIEFQQEYFIILFCLFLTDEFFKMATGSILVYLVILVQHLYFYIAWLCPLGFVAGLFVPLSQLIKHVGIFTCVSLMLLCASQKRFQLAIIF